MTATRLLMTTDVVGGVWQYSLALSGALAAQGIETVLAVLGPEPDRAQAAAARAIPGLTLVETGLALDWTCDAPGPVLAAGAAIGRLAQRHRVDLVHLNHPALGAAAPPGVPVVAVNHGCVASWWQAAWPGQAIDSSLRWHRQLVGEGLRAADQVVTPSASFARIVARCYGLPRAPRVVHNGRAPIAEPRIGMHDGALTVGRLWDTVKRADLLDRVAARLAVPFHAAGAPTGPHGETRAFEHLHLLGQLDEARLAQRLAARPVFVSAASFEPFGLAVLEAAQAGCALVLADIPTFRELWSDAALFVEGDDERGWAHAIDELIGDTERRQRLGVAARDRAARYTPERMAAEMLSVYAGLVGTRRRAGQAAA